MVLTSSRLAHDSSGFSWEHKKATLAVVRNGLTQVSCCISLGHQGIYDSSRGLLHVKNNEASQSNIAPEKCLTFGSRQQRITE